MTHDGRSVVAVSARRAAVALGLHGLVNGSNPVPLWQHALSFAVSPALAAAAIWIGQWNRSGQAAMWTPWLLTSADDVTVTATRRVTLLMDLTLTFAVAVLVLVFAMVAIRAVVRHQPPNAIGAAVVVALGSARSCVSLRRPGLRAPERLATGCFRPARQR